MKSIKSLADTRNKISEIYLLWSTHMSLLPEKLDKS